MLTIELDVLEIESSLYHTCGTILFLNYLHSLKHDKNKVVDKYRLPQYRFVLDCLMLFSK